MKIIRILSCDPGVVNCAISIMDFKVLDGKLLGIKIIDSFMATTTIKDITDASRKGFVKYCKMLKRKFKPQLLIIERFIPRGGFLKASIVECANFMISTMALIFDVETKMVTAASWKMYYKKNVDLKLLYKQFKAFGPHRIDSVLMAVRQYNYDTTKSVKLIKYVTNRLNIR